MKGFSRKFTTLKSTLGQDTIDLQDDQEILEVEVKELRKEKELMAAKLMKLQKDNVKHN